MLAAGSAKAPFGCVGCKLGEAPDVDLANTTNTAAFAVAAVAVVAAAVAAAVAAVTAAADLRRQVS